MRQIPAIRNRDILPAFGRTEGDAIAMNSKLRLLLVVLACAFLNSHALRATAASTEAEKEAILALVSRMEAAWNRGDFMGYMEGFANPDVIFVSRGVIQKDWQGTLDHYIRDYGTSEATRGRLRFFDIRIEMLAPDTAQLISRYQLDRPQNPLEGISTRLMRKRGDKWVIALNHVSARELPCPSSS
jgi:ketosteroid isomerase-like protein